MLAIGIENFQSVRERQEVPLSGITLLYGNNSSGKSIIMDAVGVAQGLYRDMPIKRNWINYRALESGESAKLSYLFFTYQGVSCLSDQRDVVSELLRPDVAEFVSLQEGDADLDLLNEYLFHTAIEVTYEWSLSSDSDCIYLSKVTIKIGKVGEEDTDLTLLSEVVYGEEDDLQLKINTEHELFQMLKHRLAESPFLDGLDPSKIDLETGFGNLHPVVERYKWSQYAFGAPDENDLGFLLAYFCTVSINDFVAKAATFEAISGIREPSEKKIGDVYTGAPHWHALKSDVLQEHLGFGGGYGELHRVNTWLSGKDYLDSGYTLSAEFKFLVDITDLESKDFSSHDLITQLKNTSQLQYSKLMLKDVHTGQLIDFTDVGTGISQALPVLYCMAKSGFSGGSVYIQQPELHLHPKLQASMAQVFVDSFVTNDKQTIYIIETHSELIILRLLKIIRENYETENLLKKRALLAEDVSVVFATKDDAGVTTYKNLRISKEGDFLDKWPQGFFEERDQELF